MAKVSVLFENPNTDGNVEAIARTCNFYGIDFYISEQPKKKLSNSRSAGAINNTPPKLLKSVGDWKGRVVVTDSSFDVHPLDFEFEDGNLIVFGNENIGVSELAKELSVAKIGLKRRGDIRCLNVACANAAILALILEKRG
jgi:tRNA G18 (ribose-2'-O)-methylase SpoU